MAHTATDPAFESLIDLHAPVRQIGSGFTFTEGPIWHPVEKHLLFSDMPADVRRRWQAGAVSEVLRPSRKGNGMTYDADLNLLVCEHATSSVARFSPSGRRTVLASHFDGRELNSPNDLCVRSDGAVYFTDPTYGRMPGFGVERPTQLGFQGVYRLPPGHPPGAEPELVVDRFTFTQPNGLCFSPCEQWMFVNDTDQANIRKYEVTSEGRLANGRVFASGLAETARAGRPDGMKCDSQGNVWVTAPGGLWVYDFHGRKLGEVSIPEMAANLHWGGADWRTLFVAASTSVYAVDTKVGPRHEPFMAARAPSAPAGPAPMIEASKTALILQDLQNDVIMPGGAFEASGAPEHAKAQNVIANAARLADAIRAKGGLVIHVWFVCEPGHPAQIHRAPLFQGLLESGALVRGSWGVAPVAGLEPKTGDLICEKNTMSAWESSRLESYLRGAGIENVISSGAWTNMSVEHTARTAADKGYRVFIPEDACSTVNADWQRASLDYALQNVSEVAQVDALIARLV
ncbi:MAG: isochorismatase family protein [Pseudomonadota bacterium]